MTRLNRTWITGIVLGLAAGRAPAADNPWTNGATDFTWNTTSADWTSPAVWNNANVDSAIFGTTGAGTIAVATPITLRGMNFEANGYTLNGSSALTLTSGGGGGLGVGEIKVVSGVSAEIGAPIGGSVGLNKTGAGTLILGGANTFTGTATVTAGTLEITGSLTNSASIGSGATLLFAQSGGATLSGTYSGGGNLAVSGSNINTTFTLSSTSNSYTGGTQVEVGTLQMGAAGVIPSGSVVTLGSGNSAGVLRLNGFDQTIGALASSGTGPSQVTNFGGTGTNTLTITGFGGTYSGLLGGASTNNNNNFAIVISGQGAQILTNANNSYTGGTTINMTGTLETPNVGALGSGSLTLNAGGATIDNEPYAVWQYTGPTASTARPTILNSNGGIIQVSTTGTTLTMSGVISETGGTGRTLAVWGDGGGGATLMLTANNTYTGPTIIDQGGVLSIPTIANGGVACPLGMASNVPANIQLGGGLGGGATLIYTGPTASTDRGVTLGAPGNDAGQNATINVATAGAALTMSGQFTGVGGLTTAGAGTLVLTNSTNNYTGGTLVTAETLMLGTAAANQIPSGSNVTVSSGAVFDLGSAGGVSNEGAPVGTITLNGGTLRSEGSSAFYFANNLAMTGGTMDLTQTGFFQLVLTGNVTVNASSTTAVWNESLSMPGQTAINNRTAGPLTITVAAGTTASGIDLDSSVSLTSPISGGSWIKAGPGIMRMTEQDFSPLALTVAAGMLRVDTVNMLNNLTGSIGGDSLTLNGGTLLYGGPTATSAANSLTLGSSNGTIAVMSAATTLTLANAISGAGSLTVAVPGTLILTNAGNTFTGGVTITQGTLSVAADNLLGPSLVPVNIGPLGTLLYTASASTARTIIMNSGVLQAAAGTTLTLNGATVGGGFLSGTFTVIGGTLVAGATTTNSSTVNVPGAASFVNFSNNGTFTAAAGPAIPITFNQFTNQGSGTITIGANSQVNAANFQTYGMLTINPAASGSVTELTNTGTSPMYFNGGSRTFLGTAATAINPATGQPADLAGVNLNGQNAVVAGGLFVNNGFVADGSASGSATIIADFGSLVKGAGFFQNSVITQNGGKFQAGNSPGSASFGNFDFGPGGVGNYVFAIDDATGTAGPSPDALGHVSGWGLVKAIQQGVGSVTSGGNFIWTATPADKLTVAIDTLVNPTTVGTDVAGPMADFDPSQPYSWLAAQWTGTYSGPTDAATLNVDTAFDASGFANPIAGTFGWSLDLADETLSLTYTPSPVPEPSSMVLAGFAAAGLAFRRRKPRPNNSG